MTDPLKYQRALFPELEPRTILVSKGGKLHRCRVVWVDQITEDICKRVRGMNSQLFISMHPSARLGVTDGNLLWEANKSSLPTWIG